MNKYKKVILFCFIIFMAVSTVYAPWQYTFHAGEPPLITKPAGYHLILIPPKPEEDRYQFGVRIDSDRYLIQILGIGILFGGGFYLLRENSQK